MKSSSPSKPPLLPIGVGEGTFSLVIGGLPISALSRLLPSALTIERFAPVDVPVLIRGESGTGKELVAKAIQRLSRRRERRFETLNYADLTRELLRS